MWRRWRKELSERRALGRRRHTLEQRPQLTQQLFRLCDARAVHESQDEPVVVHGDGEDERIVRVERHHIGDELEPWPRHVGFVGEVEQDEGIEERPAHRERAPLLDVDWRDVHERLPPPLGAMDVLHPRVERTIAVYAEPSGDIVHE